MRLTALAGETDEAIALAAALAVRAPRHGHVFVDLQRIAETASVDSEDEEIDLSELPWPSPEDWLARLAASPLVAVGEDGFPNRPLRLVGSSLYLDRYWREECRVAEDLLAFGPADRCAPTCSKPAWTGCSWAGRTTASARRRRPRCGGGSRSWPAARARARPRPWRGSWRCWSSSPAGVPPLVALAAPTGKAAQRLEEAVHEAAADPRFEAAREFMLGLSASTLHKLLGARPGTEPPSPPSRQPAPARGRDRRRDLDGVAVDDGPAGRGGAAGGAAHPGRRPGPASSIEAGAVLSDIVEAGRDGVVALDHVFRFGAGIGDLASAIRRNQPEEVLSVLRAEPEGVRWIDVDIAAPDALDKLGDVRAAALAAGAGRHRRGTGGGRRRALQALGAFRVLCAHRHGPYGVAVWMARIEAWLESELDRGRWYAGRPLLVTENDYSLHLRNGDTGVVVATAPGSVSAAFERRGEVVTFAPTRLSAVDTVYAMTVHKSQGSQFETAVVLLPSAASPILTRELLYTAVTRAQKQLVLVGTETSVRAAVGNPIARASGLRDRLRRSLTRWTSTSRAAGPSSAARPRASAALSPRSSRGAARR